MISSCWHRRDHPDARCLHRAGRFNGSQRRNGAAVALELCLPLLIGYLNSRLDLLDGYGVRLGNDETDTELRRAAVDGFRFPDIGVGPAGIFAGNDLHGIYELSGRIRHISCPP